MIFKNVNEVIGWCNAIIPTIFDDSLSYLEMVGKLKCLVFDTIKAVENLSKDSSKHNEQITDLYALYGKLEKRIKDFESGYTIEDGTIELKMLADDVLNQLEIWVAETVREVAKFVTFGLTDDGRFCAYIPTSWEFLKFDTIIDTNNEKYGHLTLEW